MQKIIPFIWFEDQAREAAQLYTSILPNSSITSNVTLPGTPSGETNIINLTLHGREFQIMSSGKLFDRNPSFSYMVACKTPEEVDRIWDQLYPGGIALMPLNTYPFSPRYGWLQDKYGVSWQIMTATDTEVEPLTPSLLFTGAVCGQAEAAMNFYCSLFPNSAPLEGHISRYGADQSPNQEGTLNYARFTLAGHEFVVMDSAEDHAFGFNEMQSLVIYCDNQAEIDYYWEKLSHVPEAEQCGWVKDKFGVSWQITPRRMDELMAKATPTQMKAMVQAFLPMKKLDIATIEVAYQNN